METSKPRGFAGMPRDKHQEASSRGGKKRVAKGFATLTPDQRKQAAIKAAQIRWAKVKSSEANSDEN